MSSFTLSPVLSSTSSPSAALSPLPTPTPYSHSPTAVKTHTQPKKPKKARSPVKGLFAFPSPPSPCAPGAIRVPQTPFAVCDRIHTCRPAPAISATSELES
ncbi:hypothetical protein DFH09DRAFT_1324879 [Mycena vulgaris]|nr:hypothetical protein DFH09DRAFT_1324879 [Mycena vulgaris]